MAYLSTFVINVRESWSDWRKQQRSWRIFELKQAATTQFLLQQDGSSSALRRQVHQLVCLQTQPRAGLLPKATSTQALGF